jgi:hypothetical protein
MDGDSKKNLMSQAAFFAEKGVPVNILHEVSAKDAADQPLPDTRERSNCSRCLSIHLRADGGTYQAFWQVIIKT